MAGNLTWVIHAQSELTDLYLAVVFERHLNIGWDVPGPERLRPVRSQERHMDHQAGAGAEFSVLFERNGRW